MQSDKVPSELQEPENEIIKSLRKLELEINSSCDLLARRTADAESRYQTREAEFQQRVAKFEQYQKRLQELYRVPEEVLEIDCGGTIFRTLKSTLISQEGSQDSMLAAMFSGLFPLTRTPHGSAFIDRNPQIFAKILDYLRTGMVPTCFADADQKKGFYEDLRFFGIQIPRSFKDSLILTPKEMADLLNFVAAPGPITLLYRGTRDGFDSATFHRLCDNKGPTVTVVLSTNNCVFGGFVSCNWTPGGAYCPDPNAFLFSLRRASGDQSPVKLLQTGNSPGNAFYCHTSYGPTFGANHDLHVANGCNGNATSSSNLGATYQRGPNFTNFTQASNNFTVKEIEVFSFA